MKLASALPCLLLASCLSATVDRERSASEELDALLGPPPATGPLTSEERTFLCAVLPDHLSKLGGDDGPAVDYTQVQARAESLRSRAMSELECPAVTPPIFWGSHFVDAFGLSTDGSFGMIEGGWQSAPLAGAGGVCYFERSGGTWRLIGCLNSWVS
jgi:hypothetical protein